MPPSRKEVGFNLLDDKDFKIPYIADIIPTSSAGHQLTQQAKRNLLIIAINGEETIKAQGVLDELNFHQTLREKSKIKIIGWCTDTNYFMNGKIFIIEFITNV